MAVIETTPPEMLVTYLWSRQNAAFVLVLHYEKVYIWKFASTNTEFVLIFVPFVFVQLHIMVTKI
jgi:hypothetical protein